MDPTTFTQDWIASWNAHNLERILSHYGPSIVFLSPVAQSLIGNGRVEGLAALRHYWGLGLAANLDLKFELIETLVGHSCLTILYRNHKGQTVSETFEFGADGKVIRSFACYS